VRKKYQDLKQNGSPAEVAKTYVEASNVLKAAKQSSDTLENQKKKYSSFYRGDHIDQGRKEIKAANDELDECFKSNSALRELVLGREEPVPRTIHLVWVGGVPKDDVTSAAKVWADSQRGVTVNVWVDGKNLLANLFKEKTEEHGAGSARRKVWEKASEQAHDEGLDALLLHKSQTGTIDDSLANLAGEKKKLDEDLKTFETELGRASVPSDSQIKIRDVSELFGARAENRIVERSLSEIERRQLQQAYQFEVQQRCNFAAGSDIVRILALHDNPGLYVDIDLTPPIKGFGELIKGLDYLTPPEEGWRDRLTREPVYQFLVAAAEEHINGVVSGRESGPARDALWTHLESTSTATLPKLKDEFDKWAARISPKQAFEELAPLKVRENMFKAFDVIGTGVASINSVLATSREGAGAIAELGRAAIEKTTEAKKDENINRYMNENDVASYRDETIFSTGPGLFSLVAERFHIETNDESMVIPADIFPHPSTAERHCSWAPLKAAVTAAERSAEPAAGSAKVQPIPQRRSRDSITAEGVREQQQPQRHPNSPRSASPASGERSSTREGIPKIANSPSSTRSRSVER
jgi:hypothetical protein